MRTTTERESLWLADSGATTEYPSVPGDLTVDVAVVGAGIAGLTTALMLKRAGVRVAVIEANRIAHGRAGTTRPRSAPFKSPSTQD